MPNKKIYHPKYKKKFPSKAFRKEKIRNIYIGVALPYVNDIFHIGHLAGAYLPPDIFARFHKLQGNRVLMVSGSDFHGTPITLRAEKEKKKPVQIARYFHQLNKRYFRKFAIEYTLYTSTHTLNHRKVVQNFFLKLLKAGFIKILKTEQLYSEKSKRFLQDRYVEGECPHCHYPEARGDQCEKCGRTLDALELINPRSKLDRSRLVRKVSENYFFDLPQLQSRVEKWLLSCQEMRSWVKKEALGWIKEGLKPRAISRDLDYGVPLPITKIPQDQRIENIENKVFYVWFEAVIGYLSAAIEYSKKIKKPNYWQDFFYQPRAETYYFVGQDNLVFHTINWPAQLIAYNRKINLPTNVFVNKFLLLEGEKMSKSRRWYIETPYFVRNYPAESLRFYLALNLPEQKELNFSWRDFVETNNSLLVGVIGNFIHRLLIFTKKNFGQRFNFSSFSLDPEVKSVLDQTFKKTKIFLEKGEFRASLKEIVNLASFGNQYIDRHKIWKMVKEDKERTKDIVANCLAIVENLRVLLYPFLPKSIERLNQMLGHRKKFILREGKNQWLAREDFETINFASTIAPLFPKIDEKNIKIEIAKLDKSKKRE